MMSAAVKSSQATHSRPSGQVEHHRRRLGHDEALVVDDRRLVKGAEAGEGLAVEFAAGVVERVHSIRQPGLFERPLRPKVFRLAPPLGKDAAEAVEGRHGGFSNTRGRRRPASP
jgi:hypothetical protein